MFLIYRLPDLPVCMWFIIETIQRKKPLVYVQSLIQTKNTLAEKEKEGNENDHHHCLKMFISFYGR